MGELERLRLVADLESEVDDLTKEVERLRAENERLLEELSESESDCEILYGPGWKKAILDAKTGGIGDVHLTDAELSSAALSNQCMQLAGDLAELHAENTKLQAQVAALLLPIRKVLIAWHQGEPVTQPMLDAILELDDVGTQAAVSDAGAALLRRLAAAEACCNVLNEYARAGCPQDGREALAAWRKERGLD